MPDKVKCKRCGHWLTDPVWIEVGYGMNCFKSMVKRKWSYWECKEMLTKLLSEQGHLFHAQNAIH